MKKKIRSARGAGRPFYDGMRDGLPIGLGYFAVAFSLGIAARAAGLDTLQATLASLLCNASAGEYAGFTVIAANSAYIEMVAVTLVANARYILMSCAMSQRFSPSTRIYHRIAMGFDITDELFGIAMARPGSLEPSYTYGAMLVSVPSVVTALGVALYGMFLAIIIPPARRERAVGITVAVSFAASFAAARLPGVSGISEGTRTVILTLVIAAAAALIFPRDEEDA